MVFVSGAGCRNEGAVSRVLEQAEDLMIGRPDSALLLLGEIDPAALARVRERTLARYSLLYSQALDKNYIDLTSDSIIRRAVNYYRKHGTPVQKGKAYFYLGRIYANAGKTEASVKAFIRAEHYLETSGDTRMKAQIYGVMGNLL